MNPLQLLQSLFGGGQQKPKPQQQAPRQANQAPVQLSNQVPGLYDSPAGNQDSWSPDDPTAMYPPGMMMNQQGSMGQPMPAPPMSPQTTLNAPWLQMGGYNPQTTIDQTLQQPGSIPEFGYEDDPANSFQNFTMNPMQQRLMLMQNAYRNLGR